MSHRPFTVCLALALVASLATSAFASCQADPSMSAGAQMACCKAGHDNDKCPMRGSAADCCKIDSQKQQQLTVAKAEPVRSALTVPPLVAIVVFGSIDSIAPVQATRVHQHDLLGIPSTPARFLASALLI